MIEFKLPSLGADQDQGKLLEWKVRPGEQVRRGTVMALVDTSKAAVDVEIWQEGTVHELRVQPGQTVAVGTVLATLLAAGEAAPPQTTATALAGDTGAPARQRVSPAARRRGQELGIALDSIAGSGEQGAVTLQDVERAAATAAAPQDRRGEMRKAIAAAMSRSKREIPHYYLADTVPLLEAQDWLRQHNEQRPLSERLLPAVLFLKAVALACRSFPEMNGIYRDDAFSASGAVHVGVAISLRGGGLVAPAIHGVEQRSLADLMRALADLVQRARAGSLRSSELSDATITVTNLGDQGVDSVFGIIYPPQVALVGFGRVREQAWVQEERLVALPAVSISLAADHRVSDGHRGALFLARIRELLQQPRLL